MYEVFLSPCDSSDLYWFDGFVIKGNVYFGDDDLCICSDYEYKVFCEI